MLKQYQEPSPQTQFSFENLLFEEPPKDQREAPALFTPEDFPNPPEPDAEISVLTVPAVPAAVRRRRPRIVSEEEGSTSREPESSDAPKKTDLARQQVDDGLKALAAELESGHSAALLKWLDTMSRFHSYSLNNTLLIAMQSARRLPTSPVSTSGRNLAAPSKKARRAS